MSYINQDEPILDALDKITQNTAGYTRYTRNPVFEKLCFYDGYYATFDADGVEIWDDDYDEWDVVHKMFKITKTLATITKGQGIQLEINEQPVKMTHPLTQKCEQLLYEYKLQSQHIKEKSVPDYNEAIKLEQKRDIYKLCQRPVFFNVLNTKKDKYKLVNALDAYRCCWVQDYEVGYMERGIRYCIPKYKKIITKMLFAGVGKFDSKVLYNKDDGLYHLVVKDRKNGELINEFTYNSFYWAWRFGHLFDNNAGNGILLNQKPQMFKVKTR